MLYSAKVKLIMTAPSYKWQAMGEEGDRSFAEQKQKIAKECDVFIANFVKHTTADFNKTFGGNPDEQTLEEMHKHGMIAVCEHLNQKGRGHELARRTSTICILQDLVDSGEITSAVCDELVDAISKIEPTNLSDEPEFERFRVR